MYGSHSRHPPCPIYNLTNIAALRMEGVDNFIWWRESISLPTVLRATVLSRTLRPYGYFEVKVLYAYFLVLLFILQANGFLSLYISVDYYALNRAMKVTNKVVQKRLNIKADLMQTVMKRKLGLLWHMC